MIVLVKWGAQGGFSLDGAWAPLALLLCSIGVDLFGLVGFEVLPKA
jgi:hypothetical protein